MDLKENVEEESKSKEPLEKFENVFDQAFLTKERIEEIERDSAELRRESRSERNRRKRFEWWFDVFKM